MTRRNVVLMLLALILSCRAFVIHPSGSFRASQPSNVHRLLAYVPPAPEESSTKSKPKPLYPNVGDIVRYTALDGGRADGEVLVGKVTFIQKRLDGSGSGWLLEITQLEDLGEGYFADYPARVRKSKKALRDLSEVQPIAAAFVGSENAFKVPRDPETGLPRARTQSYTPDGYQGPFAGDNAINQSVVEADGLLYLALKGKLLRYSAIAGAAGTLIADLVKGTEDAIIYAAGAFASILYLGLLSLKTDTIAGPDAKFGDNLSTLRFAMPFLVLAGVAVYNASLGGASPVSGKGPLDTVTAEQLAAALLGFLTYRIPLFLVNISQALRATEDGDLVLPGSAGIAMKLAQQTGESSTKQGLIDDALVSVLLVSGPQATGRSELVRRLIDEGEGRFVEPKRIDSVKDGATFERLAKREEFLSVDPSGRYGLTGTAIIESARGIGPDSVVVVDADTKLANALTKVPGIRLVGVWIGLNSVKEFEARLASQIEKGEIQIPPDETRESVMRARVREIVQEIEYGISSGIFEFTILNDDEESSLRQLREAASYCFK